MMTNSEQMQHTVTVRGARTVISIHSVATLAETQACILHANGHRGAECNPAINCPKHVAPVAAIRIVAGSGERVSSRFIMSHACSIDERPGVLAGQGSCYTPRRSVVCEHALSC